MRLKVSRGILFCCFIIASTGFGCGSDDPDPDTDQDMGAVDASVDMGDMGTILDGAIADSGQDAGDVGQDAGDVGQDAGDVGQDAGDVGQDAGDVGQDAGDVGQGAGDGGVDLGLDAGTDTGIIDPDLGTVDSGVGDTGSTDAPDMGSADVFDGGPVDVSDMGSVDIGDGGPVDASDGGPVDASDGGPVDASDGGSTDTGDLGVVVDAGLMDDAGSFDGGDASIDAGMPVPISVTQILPATAPIGAHVLVRGTALDQVSEVLVDDIIALVDYRDSHHLVVVIPDGSSGPADITLLEEGVMRTRVEDYPIATSVPDRGVETPPTPDSIRAFTLSYVPPLRGRWFNEYASFDDRYGFQVLSEVDGLVTLSGLDGALQLSGTYDRRTGYFEFRFAAQAGEEVYGGLFSDTGTCLDEPPSPESMCEFHRLILFPRDAGEQLVLRLNTEVLN